MILRLISLLTISLLFSCSAPRYILDTEKVTFNDLLNGIIEEQNKIHSVIGKSRISIDTEEYSGNFFAEIVYKDSDSLLINVSGPFGINVGKMFIGNDRFIFLNNYANQFYTGSLTKFKNQNFLQFPININELSDLFIGKDFINNMKIIDYTVKDDLFFIHGKNSQNNYNIWIDNLTGRIKKVEYIYHDKITLIKEYDKYDKLNGLYFPKFIKLTKPLEKQSVSIYYDWLKLNEEISASQFAVKINDSARQINLNLQEMKE